MFTYMTEKKQIEIQTSHATLIIILSILDIVKLYLCVIELSAFPW